MKIKLSFLPRLSIERSLSLRLIVAVPTITASLTMASGFLTLQLCRILLKRAGAHESASEILGIAFWIIGLVLVAILSGLLLAMGIVRPLKRILKDARSKMPSGIAGVETYKETSSIDEISQFNRIMGQTILSLDGYVNDSYILDRLPEGIISIDDSGIITRMNQVASNIIGVEDKEIKGKSYLDFFEDVVEGQGLCAMVKNALEKRNAYYQKRAVMKVGNRVSDILVNIHPIQNETRAVGSLLLSFRSLSEAMEVRYRIRQIDQLATVGVLSAGLAHEIRNPLGYISNLLELLQPKIASDPTASSYLDMILKGIFRLDNLVEELLSYSKSSNINQTRSELAPILAEAIAIAQNSTGNGKKIRLAEDYDPNLKYIYGDPEKLTQAFSNLLLNAYQATPDSGQVRVSTKIMVNSSGRDISVISISNSGSYIPPQDMERIFSPFYTTKSDGTGLGLPIVMQIITAHSGNITLTSDMAEGTTFRVEIPMLGQ